MTLLFCFLAQSIRRFADDCNRKSIHNMNVFDGERNSKNLMQSVGNNIAKLPA